MQNFSLKVCLRHSKRSQFYDHIVCPFSSIHFKMIFKSAKWRNLVIASNSDPLCSFYKTVLLVFETFCTFSFAITKWPHFYNSSDFSQVQWLKPEDIYKKKKFIFPTTAIVSNITVFLFTYCYTKTILRTPCSSSKRDI